MVELESVPDLVNPVLVAAFEGWNDAGEAASGVIQHLESNWNATPIAEVDPDDYYDFQVTRPLVELVDGETREITWPTNVERIEHLAPASHRRFYNSQRYTLNLTRADMRRAGHSPSVRIFEAAACGTAIISDKWPGLETFFHLENEILTASSAEEVLTYLSQISEDGRRALGGRARLRVLASHTSEQRAIELENYVAEVMKTTSTAASAEPAGAIA